MRRLVSLGILGAICVAAVIAYFVSWPSQNEMQEEFSQKPYYVSAPHAISKSPDCIAAAIRSRIDKGDNVRILMGSSELGLVEPLSSHPYHFFNECDYPIDTISIGSAGFQSLFHAIELGSLDYYDAVPDKKVALIVSMQWFYGNGCQPSAFQTSFSWKAYEAFMANDGLSEETREMVKERAIQLGIDPSDSDAASGEGSVEVRINYAVNSFIREGSRLAEIQDILPMLRDLTDKKMEKRAVNGLPDWEEWLNAAMQDAASDCTTNQWGIYDSYWEEYTLPWLEKYDPEDYAEPFSNWNNDELYDLEIFFRVCDELDIEPIIIIMPVKGYYYDLTQYSRDSRSSYYRMVQEACDEAGVAYASYIDHEYDKYFMHDIMHLGSLGWVYVNHDMMQFFLGDSVGDLPETNIEQAGSSPFMGEVSLSDVASGGPS